MRCWICQVDTRTGLVKARSCDEPCFTICAQGLGDSFAGPYFVVSRERDPTGMTAAELENEKAPDDLRGLS